MSRPEYGLYQEVEVEPAVDFRNLTRVLVVLSPPPPPDPIVLAPDGKGPPSGTTQRGKREPQAAFGVRPYR